VCGSYPLLVRGTEAFHSSNAWLRASGQMDGPTPRVLCPIKKGRVVTSRRGPHPRSMCVHLFGVHAVHGPVHARDHIERTHCVLLPLLAGPASQAPSRTCPMSRRGPLLPST
jgi:hypothetical protein